MINLLFFRFVLTIILQFIAASMIIPILVSLVYKDGMIFSFIALVIALLIFSYLIKPNIELDKIRIRARDVFLINLIMWLMVCLISALPYSLFLKMDFIDAWFEAVSGITTTGASILDSVNKLQPSIIIWRQMTNWLGGIGFMSIGLLVFSNLNVGELKLIQLDGQLTNKVLPQYRQIALAILKLYFVLTIFAIVLLYFSGMDIFHAFAMALSSVSTGGFAPEDAGILHYGITSQYAIILIIAICSLPFVTYLLCYRLKSIMPFFRDSQIRMAGFLALIFGTVLILTLGLNHIYDWNTSFRMGIITVVNFMSTSGFSQGPFDQWGPFVIVVLAIIWMIGGASGSTSAGLKIFRFSIMLKILGSALKHISSPKSIQNVYHNGRKLDNKIQVSVVSYLLLYLVTILVFAMLFTLTGMDLEASLSTALNVISNIGPSMGDAVGSNSNFSSISDSAKWLMTFGMILGRLELTAVLVLLIPSFWKF